MNRTTAVWFGVAGISALLRFGLHYVDPAFYDAASLIDYAAVVSLTLVYVATGVALILLWRDPPVARGSLFLLFAFPGEILGFGLVLMGVSWILFALWIVSQRRAYVIALSVAAAPALAYSIYLYGADVISSF